MRLLHLAVFSFGLCLSPLAWAQDEEDDDIDLDDFGEDDDDDDLGVKRIDEDDAELADPDDIPLDEGPLEVGPELDLDDDLDELGDDEISTEGQDNSAIYRKAVEQAKELRPEEELLHWERYLNKYPNTLFRDRIDQRVNELGDAAYDERIDRPGDGYEDAKDREIHFAQPILLENPDPRSRLRVAGEMGFPDYLGVVVDFEYAFLRQASAHVAARSRYTGFSVETGAKYALIKSARTNTLLTGLFDLHINLDPDAYLGLRPQIAFGQRLEVLGRPLDLQVQTGLELEARSTPGVRYIGGVNASYQVTDVVSVFAEGSYNLKASKLDLTSAGPFAFNVLTFGMRFSPAQAKFVTVNLNANAPVSYNYWSYHTGAVQVEGNLYLDELQESR